MENGEYRFDVAWAFARAVRVDVDFDIVIFCCLLAVPFAA